MFVNKNFISWLKGGGEAGPMTIKAFISPNGLSLILTSAP